MALITRDSNYLILCVLSDLDDMVCIHEHLIVFFKNIKAVARNFHPICEMGEKEKKKVRMLKKRQLLIRSEIIFYPCDRFSQKKGLDFLIGD